MNSLDLHGIKHAEVKQLFDTFIYENMKKRSFEVEVITGISDQMKKIVFELTDEYKFDYYQDLLNPGKIIIKII